MAFMLPRILFSNRPSDVCVTIAAGMKRFTPPVNYDNIEFPERTRLKYVDKAPQYPPNIRPPKMTKSLRLMRGPEKVHNSLLHEQYGIIALTGGRLKWGHFEMVRLAFIRKADPKTMFAVWRVDAPWQPVTKKGQGQRMGGGKGSIDHYVTPIKAGRVIIEVGGRCSFEKVKPMLTMIAEKLPFDAKVVSHQMLIESREEEKMKEKLNVNPYTFKYVVLNNLGGCHNWVSPVDFRWFGKYI